MRSILPALVCLTLLGTPAMADDHEPPAVSLAVGEITQKGVLHSFCWIAGSVLAGSLTCEQRGWPFPKAAAVAGPEASVTFDKVQEPKELSIRAWRRLRKNGRPRKPVRLLAATLTPAVGLGNVGWSAAIMLPTRPGSWYLEVRGMWTDEESVTTMEQEQNAAWLFHVRLPSG